MTLESVLDVVGAVLILIGAFFTLTAAIGILRLPDVLNRMHAASKPQTLGFLLLCVGLSLVLRDGSATAMLAVAACLQLVTSPVATQMMAKAAHRSRQYRADLVVDDRERERIDDDADRAGLDPDEADPDAGRPSG
ncbi:monovalent cation/H(+) antiporter subunit G [Agrococcus sp. Marseille-Q4369]|uniref:monovalent cation/H(+) antiporter subunit G n=1 Tax=Agrococcus sp. Marseille-Q4369 TaxID=2810513 RepID=UPI001B8C7F44|nr:monovalent cation/H(+) antiporter subunit G [Agrococcus sp. Marseille-Q4369]QUW18779.1 monovalent cation/H(+) antiporter subunit G [Agrococcus sp. Marseille-Q4369]